MTLIYNHCYVLNSENNEIELEDQLNLYNKLRHIKLPIDQDIGDHHSKVSMFAYADGSLRVVVMSANLREEDWSKFTQGIWVSPKFPLKKENNTDDSQTNFKKDILRYLKSYNQDPLNEWIEKVEKVDFSQANVFFIPSVPGKHTDQLWGHLYLKSILKNHASLPYRVPSEWPIIAQCSSLGSLGATEKEWLTSEFVDSLSAFSTNSNTSRAGTGRIPFHLIYPSVNNVLTSWNRGLGGRCLLYHKSVHLNQLWLKNYMHLWQSESRKRTRSMPHIQTYCRVSPCHTDMSWFLLTTANLSKDAWGTKLRPKKNSIGTFEAGVLFLPKFVAATNTFCIDKTSLGNDSSPYFTLPFDLPITRYLETDVPWNAKPL